MPGDEDSRAGRRVTKTLTPGAGFRVKHAIRPQSAVTRVANLPRGEWSCGHSPLRPASAVVREHFAWRLAKSPAEEAAAEEAAAEEAGAEEAGAEEAGTASAAAADGADGADADGADGEGERSCGHSPPRPASAAVARGQFAWRLAESAGCTPRASAAMAACAVADSVINGRSRREEPTAAAAAAAASTPDAQYAASTLAAHLHGANKPTSSPRQPAPKLLTDSVVRADAGLVGMAAAGRCVRMAPRIARGCDTVPFASVRVFDRPSSALRGNLSVRVRYH